MARVQSSKNRVPAAPGSSGKSAPAAKAAQRGLEQWFGDPAGRRPTVAPWRIDRLASSPSGATPLPRPIAWFAAHVMLHGGVFSGLQLEQWLRNHDTRWPADKAEKVRLAYRQRFIQPYFTHRFGGRQMASHLRFPGGARFAHFSSRPAYAAIGVENSRYRRQASMELVVRRLLAYDYLLERPDLGWIGPGEDKLAFFDALEIDRSVLPRRVYRAAADPRLGPAEKARVARRAKASAAAVPSERVAFFPEHLPIGYGPWRVVFLLPSDVDEDSSAEVRVRGYEDLWRELRARGVRVSVVFILRGGPGRPPPIGSDALARDASSADRERLLAQVERAVLESSAGRSDAARLFKGLDVDVPTRLKQLDALLSSPLPEVPVAPRARQRGVMDVATFLSGRLASSRWAVTSPAPVQVDV